MDVPLDSDLYGLIGVEETSTVQEIKKAYRKKALSCHPDKNPGNPNAAELFHELSRALEILTDESARAAYNNVIVARRQAKLRVKEFDAKRKRLKEELEAREDAYRRSSDTSTRMTNDEQKLRAEIERLRKEGSKQVEEEIALVNRKILSDLQRTDRPLDSNRTCHRIKIKWKVNKADSTDRYNHDTLHCIFSKYGDINALVISSSKRGSAMVEFANKKDAETAISTEIGFAGNPLTLRGLWKSTESDLTRCDYLSKSSVDVVQNEAFDVEFERAVLNNLKRAEESKRLSEKT